MNEPQVWTLIGVFGAALLGGFTLVTTHFGRVLRAEIGRVEGTLSGRIDALDVKLSDRIDTLDEEVSDIATRFFGTS